MKATSLPTKVQLPFGANSNPAYMRTVPVPSQQGITLGAASFNDGFPPVCFEQVGSGGVPPAGPDFQYLFYLITSWNQWQSAGGTVSFDAAFSMAVGGYPAGAVVASTTPGILWLSTADNNTTNPDSASAANWTALLTTGSALGRIRLTSNTNFYVSPSGSDVSGDGKTNATAWATPQKALNYLQMNYDLAGFTATINCASGTYTGGVQAVFPIPGMVNSNSIVLQGAGSASTNMAVSGGTGFLAAAGGFITVSGFKITATVGGATSNSLAGAALGCAFGGNIQIGSDVNFGACDTAHMLSQGGNITANGRPYTISGGSVAHISAQQNALITIASSAATLIATPSFSTAFAVAVTYGTISAGGFTYSGSATGQRYAAPSGYIQTNGGGSTFFPGSTAGASSLPGLVT